MCGANFCNVDVCNIQYVHILHILPLIRKNITAFFMAIILWLI